MLFVANYAALPLPVVAKLVLLAIDAGDVVEWTRFCQGFDRVCDANERIDRNAFRDGVLGTYVPYDLGERIFSAFTNGKQGHVTKEVLLNPIRMHFVHEVVFHHERQISMWFELLIPIYLV